jgi:hypothetical protein
VPHSIHLRIWDTNEAVQTDRRVTVSAYNTIYVSHGGLRWVLAHDGLSTVIFGFFLSEKGAHLASKETVLEISILELFE